MLLSVDHSGWLHVEGETYKCALGRGGVRADKKEGDGATPIGTFPLRRVYYRVDRISRPATNLPVIPIAEDDAWCDDPDYPLYNTKVVTPYPARTEPLWRDDHLYDVLVVLGHNDAPVVPGAGSAIFLHVAADDYAPTEGCVALALDDLLAVLRLVDRSSVLAVA
jgi:L,D-peptidoglycan transpeptidase YkuD (ErfK/YbiS/YcfS/YnhG family)